MLLNTKANGKVDSMTISWGSLGIEWGKPIFTAYVREGRFTMEQLRANPEFTVSVPLGEFSRRILGFCGTKSGREIDKTSELGLTLEDPSVASVPGIKELPLTLECKVVYSQAQDPSSISPANLEEFYPQDVPGTYHGANRDLHTAFLGEIVSAYIIR